MDLTEEVDHVADRVEEQFERVQSEEATKHALIIPFIKALGYDPYDLEEVVPEFRADFVDREGEKVDYAIMQDGDPVILMECETAGSDLSIDQAEQLFRYFQVTDARVGIITNGVEYRFYSDLEKSNKMDEQPFHELDLLDYTDREVEELKSLRNSTFDLDEMIDAAHDLKYRKALQEYLGDGPSMEEVGELAEDYDHNERPRRVQMNVKIADEVKQRFKDKVEQENLEMQFVVEDLLKMYLRDSLLPS